jgi:hypothetical protein
MRLDIASLVVEEDLRPFRPINPPFNFNAPGVAAYAPEVTGYYLLQAVLQRLGWTSFAGKPWTHTIAFTIQQAVFLTRIRWPVWSRGHAMQQSCSRS